MQQPDYWLEVFQMEHNARLRAAQRGRLVAPAAARGPVRRRFGSALIRLGVMVGGPALAGSPALVPAHGGGAAR